MLTKILQKNRINWLYQWHCRIMIVLIINSVIKNIREKNHKVGTTIYIKIPKHPQHIFVCSAITTIKLGKAYNKM